VKERAKVAVLLIIQKFAETGIFGKEECKDFMGTYLETITDDMLFRIKKYLLPALISMGRHLDYNQAISSVYTTFTQFTKDSVWAVRKTAIEKLPEMVRLLKKDEVGKF
jgi:hypothetical protein